jgi:hypothetical protein
VSNYLLDTSFLIGLLNETNRRELGPARRFWARMPSRGHVYVSIVSLAELLEGATDPAAAERAVGFLAKPLGLFHQHAGQAARLQRRARSLGTRMGENDAWIAATAILAQLKVIGDDDAAFSGRPSLGYANFRTGTP